MKPTNTTKILLTGAYGQVGWELNRALLPWGEVRAFDKDTLNLLDESAVREEVRSFKPGVIINAAAYTAVDRAEVERDLCRSLNVRVPGILAEEAETLGAWVIHYSTDYVFNGKNDRPWTEDDAPDPVNYYGESKLEGDMAVARAAARHLIFRTSWVYASRGSNFPLTMLRLFAEKRELSVVNDQLGAPTWARYIAQATLSALGRSLKSGGAGLSGVYNLVNSGVTSWYEFAREIRDCAGGFDDVVLSPISSENYKTAAARPKWSVLSMEKINRVFGVYPAHWRDAMKLCVAEIKERQNTR